MTAEKYYRFLLENGVEKFMSTAAKREKIQIKLVLAFGLEVKRDLAQIEENDHFILNEDYIKAVLNAQNNKWNQLADMFFNLHGISLLKKDYFSSIWDTEDLTSLILDIRNKKGKGE